MKQTLIFIFLLSAFSAHALAQAPESKTVKRSEEVTIKSKFTAKDYETMLEKLKTGDLTINFAALRLAYTETKDYSPYGGAQLRGEMMEKLLDDKFEEAISAAQRMLRTNFVDLHAHFVMWQANEALENDDVAEFHKKVLNALMDAINENDGLSEKTAMISIGISEQYFVMDYMGFERGSKALVNSGGSMFDVHTVQNRRTSEARKFYFNIDKVFGRLF